MTNKQEEWVSGLPPVGEPCLVLDGDEYIPSVVTAIGKLNVLVVHDSNPVNEWVYVKEGAEFKPLKSPEDLEREEAVAGMVVAVWPNVSKKACGIIHDAGYHNGVKVGEEVSVGEFIDKLAVSPYKCLGDLLEQEDYVIYKKVN